VKIAFAKPCAVCGARALPGSNRCAAHPKPAESEAQRAERHPYRRLYTSAEYRRNRLARYQLAGGRCENCGAPLSRGAFETHHLLPWDNPRTNEVAWLRVACRGCHRAATAAGRRARRREPDT
jgi:5-methylcytosine-specific restriction endonuclease McrA